ncbi:hypothetical protein ACOJVU_04105 [Mycobacterium sp. THU-M104]|uniref:hypothetical protein n=1 Tax=Mycobacterium sp. THU-M104 TaxID=3410515 RepID=UPI003B9C6302
MSLAAGSPVAPADEARAQIVKFATADATVAYAAFTERRDASFTGHWALTTSESE